MGAKLTIKRRAWPVGDLMRAYSVWVDGEQVGTIRRRQERSWEIAPGHHTLELKIDWCTSPALEFDSPDGAETAFVCRAQGTATSAASLARPHDYIRLEQVAPGA